MSWSLNVTGESLAHETEQKLVAELRKVLSNPEFAAIASFFRGNHLASPVHVAADPAPEPEAVPQVADAAPEPAAPKATPAKAAASTRAAKATKAE